MSDRSVAPADSTGAPALAVAVLGIPGGIGSSPPSAIRRRSRRFWQLLAVVPAAIIAVAGLTALGLELEGLWQGEAQASHAFDQAQASSRAQPSGRSGLGWRGS